MKKITIEPLKKVGDIAFGMTRNEVRKVLGDAVTFMKTPDDDSLTDDFGFCHIYYDADDRCEAVEIWDAEVYIKNEIRIIKHIGDDLYESVALCINIEPADEKAIFIKKLEGIESRTFFDIEADDEGFISIDYSIGITAPDEEMEGILIGKENYYVEDNKIVDKLLLKYLKPCRHNNNYNSLSTIFAIFLMTFYFNFRKHIPFSKFYE